MMWLLSICWCALQTLDPKVMTPSVFLGVTSVNILAGVLSALGWGYLWLTLQRPNPTPVRKPWILEATVCASHVSVMST